MSRQKARLFSRQINATLSSQQRAVHPHISDEHRQTLSQCTADRFAAFDILTFNEGNAVGQRPGITLTRNGTKLIGHGQTLFVRGDYGSEKLAGEFVPEVVEKILHRAADAAMVIGRPQQNDIRTFHARLQSRVVRRVVSRVGVVKCERFFLQIEHVHGTTSRLELAGKVIDYRSRH